MNTITKKYAPHQAHKHHYGWVRNSPVPSVLLWAMVSFVFVFVYVRSGDDGETVAEVCTRRTDDRGR
jgi:hypothetical protein